MLTPQGDDEDCRDRCCAKPLSSPARTNPLQLPDSQSVRRSGSHPGELGTRTGERCLFAQRLVTSKTRSWNSQQSHARWLFRGRGLHGGYGAARQTAGKPGGASCCPAKRDPFARVDASAMAHANLTESQRAVAKTQEDALRLILGSELQRSGDLRGDSAQLCRRARRTIRKRSTGILQSRVLSRNLGQCAFEPAIILRRSAASPVRLKNSRLSFLSARCWAWPTSHQINTLMPRRPLRPLGVAGMQDGTVGYAWAASLARLGNFERGRRSFEAV